MNSRLPGGPRPVARVLFLGPGDRLLLLHARIFPGGPKVLKPKAKLTVKYRVTYDCATPLTVPTGGDYAHVATVHHEVLDGRPDAHGNDDACPHSVTPPFELDGAIKDKGCGVKKPDKTFGDPIVTDVATK